MISCSLVHRYQRFEGICYPLEVYFYNYVTLQYHINRHWSGQSGTGAVFLQVLRLPLPILIPLNAPYPSIIRHWYNRPTSDRRTKWTQVSTHLHEIKKNRSWKLLFWISSVIPVKSHQWDVSHGLRNIAIGERSPNTQWPGDWMVVLAQRFRRDLNPGLPLHSLSLCIFC